MDAVIMVTAFADTNPIAPRVNNNLLIALC